MITACSGRDYGCTLQINEFVSLIRALLVRAKHAHPHHFSPVGFSEVQTENANNKSAFFNYTIRRSAMLKTEISFAARQPITASHCFYCIATFTPFSLFLSLSLSHRSSPRSFHLYFISSHSKCNLQCPGTNAAASHRAFLFLLTFSACTHVAFAHK